MITKITIRNAIDQFPQYVQMKGKTESTAKAYLCDLNQFYIFIHEKYKNLVYVDALNRTHIMDYFLHLQKLVSERKYHRPSYDRKCDSLITFCKYLDSFRYTDGNILAGYSYTRVKTRYDKDTGNDFNPYVFSKQEIAQIIEFVMNSSEKSKYRDLAIIEMLTELGIRRSTLLVATWEDIDFINRTMVLHHVKDHKTTKVEISKGLCISLENYQFVANRFSGRVFFSNSGLPLSNSAFNDLIKKCLTYVGAYQKGATSHSFRHTFIMSALRNNINPYKIIKYTGHKEISSLKPYENLIPDDLSDLCKISEVHFNNELLKKAC